MTDRWCVGESMGRRLVWCLWIAAVAGCLPELPADCASAEDCGDGRACVGGVCFDHDAGGLGRLDTGGVRDAAPDMHAADGAHPDAAMVDASTVDAGPPPDGGLPDAAPAFELCNGLDDDGDTRADEGDACLCLADELRFVAAESHGESVPDLAFRSDGSPVLVWAGELGGLYVGEPGGVTRLGRAGERYRAPAVTRVGDVVVVVATLVTTLPTHDDLLLWAARGTDPFSPDPRQSWSLVGLGGADVAAIEAQGREHALIGYLAADGPPPRSIGFAVYDPAADQVLRAPTAAEAEGAYLSAGLDTAPRVESLGPHGLFAVPFARGPRVGLAVVRPGDWSVVVPRTRDIQLPQGSVAGVALAGRPEDAALVAMGVRIDSEVRLVTQALDLRDQALTPAGVRTEVSAFSTPALSVVLEDAGFSVFGTRERSLVRRAHARNGEPFGAEPGAAWPLATGRATSVARAPEGDLRGGWVVPLNAPPEPGVYFLPLTCP